MTSCLSPTLTAPCSCPRELASCSGLTNCLHFPSNLHQLFSRAQRPLADQQFNFSWAAWQRSVAISHTKQTCRRADLPALQRIPVADHTTVTVHHEHHRASSISQQAIFLICASKVHRDTFSLPGDALQLIPTDSPAHPPHRIMLVGAPTTHAGSHHLTSPARPLRATAVLLHEQRLRLHSPRDAAALPGSAC